jgi:transmembrane sensor
MEVGKQIEDIAAEFLARRDGGQWTQEDEARFTQWMQAQTAHRIAVLRLEAGWAEASRIRVLSAGSPPGVVPARGAWRQSPFFDPTEAASGESRSGPIPVSAAGAEARRWKGRLGAAASLLLVIGVGAYFTLDRGGDRYSTPIGGVATVPLSDGSNITLNTGSKVRVDLSATERRVDLERGEAFFEVAKDPLRPFFVRVGDKRVVAVGTKFSVSREDNGVKVVVSEGTVRLESDSQPLHGERQDAGTNLTKGDGTAVPLSAGTLARMEDQSLLVQNATPSQVRDALSWRQGYLTFHETPLAEVIEQFNRYNTHKIVIGDPAVAAIRINGAFRPTNYQVFVRLLEEGFFLQVTTTGDQSVLTQQ